MSTKRKNTGKPKNRAKSRKVEYDEEDISSEHDSEIDDAEAGSNADGEDATAEDALADVSNMPELPAPEVIFFLRGRTCALCRVGRTWSRDASRKSRFILMRYVFISN